MSRINPKQPSVTEINPVNHALPPTEQTGPLADLDQRTIADLTRAMHLQNSAVQSAVEKALPALIKFLEILVPRMRSGGRLFYIGAGTSGRLGVIDASECPPTFGVSPDMIIGLMAGGDGALRVAIEGAEDNYEAAQTDLVSFRPNPSDTLVGIAASGRTPYVVGGLKYGREQGLVTACITCNPESAAEEACEYPIVAVTGPEFITGSTRLNAGTATKLLLNMITTVTMIQLGRVQGNRMVDMKLSNSKLEERGQRMIVDATGVSPNEAKLALRSWGNVRDAIQHLQDNAHS